MRMLRQNNAMHNYLMKRNLVILAISFAGTLILAIELMHFEFAALGGERPWKTLYIKVAERYGAGFANAGFLLMTLFVAGFVGIVIFIAYQSRRRKNVKERGHSPPPLRIGRATKRARRFRAGTRRQ